MAASAVASASHRGLVHTPLGTIPRMPAGITAIPKPAQTRASMDVLREITADMHGTKPRRRQRSVTRRASPPRSRWTADTKGSDARSASASLSYDGNPLPVLGQVIGIAQHGAHQGIGTGYDVGLCVFGGVLGGLFGSGGSFMRRVCRSGWQIGIPSGRHRP